MEPVRQILAKKAIYTNAHAGVIESVIAKAKREIILKSGHPIPLEQPEIFNLSVMEFIKNMEFNNILNSQGVSAAVQYFKVYQE